MSVIAKTQYEPIDIDQVRRDNPLPAIVGADVKLIRAGREFKACCPFHAEKTPSFTIFDGGNRFQCFGCGASGDVVDFIMQMHGVDFLDAVRMLDGGSIPTIEVAKLPPAVPPAEKIVQAQRIWDRTKPIKGTLAQDYLASRGVTCVLPDVLRFDPCLGYWIEKDKKPVKVSEHPALVAMAQDIDGKLSAVQRIYLKDDGSGKADVPDAKKTAGVLFGSAIRLGPVSASLTLCEGLEDALSIQQDCGRVTWAAAGANTLSRVQLPNDVERVVIAGDNDTTGLREAQSAADAFAAQDKRCRTIFPDSPFKDFNEQMIAEQRERGIL